MDTFWSVLNTCKLPASTIVLSSSVGMSGWCRLQPLPTVVDKNSSLSDKNESFILVQYDAITTILVTFLMF